MVALPTLSQVQSWETEHLREAATAWTNLADTWDDSFTSVARQMVEPGGKHWSGDAAATALSRAALDRQKVQGLSDDLRAAASVARGATGEIDATKRAALHVVGEAHAEGFIVGDDLSLTDGLISTSLAETAVRDLQARALSAEIRQRAAILLAVDQEVAQKIASAAEGLSGLSFETGGAPQVPASIQPVEFSGSPLPQMPSWTSPDPPPGGWSNDPVTRAAQKIAYGHASGKHLASEWPPGTTREQLASEVERIMRAGMNPNGGMVVGRTGDGAPAIYDPKTNTLVIRDPGAADAGTVFRPTRGEPYIADKIPTRLLSLSPNELADAPARPRLELPREEPQSPRSGPRIGLPPMVGVPPLVDLPGSGAGGLPVFDVDGPPDVGLPGAGR